MGKISIVLASAVIGALCSVAALMVGHDTGKNEGFEAGRYAEHEYLETKALAQTCDDWVTIYNAKKPGNTDHVEKSCDAIRRTAQSYVGDTSDGSAHNGIVDNAGYLDGEKPAVPAKSTGHLRAAVSGEGK